MTQISAGPLTKGGDIHWEEYKEEKQMGGNVSLTLDKFKVPMGHLSRNISKLHYWGLDFSRENWTGGMCHQFLPYMSEHKVLLNIV